MDPTLEIPPEIGIAYAGRGVEVSRVRPISTGDVFANLNLSSDAKTFRKGMVISHPCALRKGVKLQDRLLIAEVIDVADLKGFNFASIDWQRTNFARAPLPELLVGQSGSDHVVDFDSLFVVDSELLQTGDRLVTLDFEGVAMIMQRWVHHQTRVVVPTPKFVELMGGPMAEIDLVEEWVERAVRGGSSELGASAEVHTWLRDVPSAGGESSRQDLLALPSYRGQPKTGYAGRTGKTLPIGPSSF